MILRNLALLAALSSATASAAALANYTFTAGTTTNASTTATASAQNSFSPVNYSLSAFAGGSGLVGNISTSNPITGFSTTNPTGGSNTQHLYVRVGGTGSANETDYAGAVSENDYFGFSITPTTGYSLHLTSLTFDLVLSYSTDAFKGTVFVRSSVDGFTSNLYSITLTAGTGTGLVPGYSVDLSGSAFSNLTSATEFRIYFADDINGTSTSSVFRMDNVILNGDLIPEPSSAALLGLGGLLLAGRRHRRM